jgi:hypothetical protein
MGRGVRFTSRSSPLPARRSIARLPRSRRVGPERDRRRPSTAAKPWTPRAGSTKGRNSAARWPGGRHAGLRAARVAALPRGARRGRATGVRFLRGLRGDRSRATVAGRPGHLLGLIESRRSVVTAGYADLQSATPAPDTRLAIHPADMRLPGQRRAIRRTICRLLPRMRPRVTRASSLSRPGLSRHRATRGASSGSRPGVA